MLNIKSTLILFALSATSLAHSQNYGYSTYPQYQEYPYQNQMGYYYQPYAQQSPYDIQVYSNSYPNSYGQQGYYQGQQGYPNGQQGYYQMQQGYNQGEQGNQGYYDESKISKDKNKSSDGDKEQKVPDEMITGRIMQNIRNTPYLSPLTRNIQVETKDGEVTLKGKVMNKDEGAQIMHMSKNVPGVKSVSNDLESEK